MVNGRNLAPDTSVKRDNVEYSLVILGSIYFFAPFFHPGIVDYPFIDKTYSWVTSIYNAPIIGWGFKIIGAFYTVVIVFKGFSFLNYSGKRKNSHSSEPPNDDEFVDYEEVD